MCACTHYLVFKEPTPAVPRTPGFPDVVATDLSADRAEGNLLRLLEAFLPVNPDKWPLIRR